MHLRKELGESLPADIPSVFGDPSLVAVFMATTYGKGPSQELEFVAKSLTYGPLPATFGPDEKNILVGTPLYVAMST
jgi:hypothetical protein